MILKDKIYIATISWNYSVFDYDLDYEDSQKAIDKLKKKVGEYMFNKGIVEVGEYYLYKKEDE